MVEMGRLLDDLDEESRGLDALVAERPAVDWAEPTPAPGWTIAHQIAHLAWTDHVALLAATDASTFFASIRHAATDPGGFVDRGANELLDEVMAATPGGAVDRAGVPTALLERWRAGRSALSAVLGTIPGDTRLPWYGTRMSAASMATARIMETWAHGQDIADTLGVSRNPSGRLRHVAYLGFRTLGHSFATHGLATPDVPVRVELRAPDGDEWVFGPADAADRVAGPALDFCLLVTQRRHRTDLALVASGRVADEWLDVAQAFAGPPGAGREPGVGRDVAGRLRRVGGQP
ncbi:TIGR03084 family metal-binding protein [Micromonospora sp. NPDC050397]|uniref:TIGR03084 family metal-binding protein n=1 Tax=Micromonospora sp. NPDC050397 TaxID=3364279 RepID=UPI00384A95B5